jgi:uncharacterized membrane protein YjfL (UPF0719 family)
MARVNARGGGWLAFAGTMTVLVGAFNLVDGVVAVSKHEYVADDLLFGDLTVWGWVMIAFGVAQVAAGVAIFARAFWGSLVGIVLAGFNAVAQLGFLRHYPEWSTIIIVVDALVIYALTMYGGRRDAYNQ